MNGNSVIDVSDVLNRQKIGPVHLLVLGLTAMAMMIDGYDVFVISFVLPAIAKDLGVAPHQLTAVLLAQQVGLAIGAFVVGPIADRFGRRKILLVSAALFGVITLAITQTRSIETMAILRLITGMFLSGVIPNAIALTSEIAPQRSRATLITIMFCGYTFGASAGGYAATLLIDRFGWQGAFWGGGLLPLAMLPICYVFLPESIYFRAQRNDRDPRIGQMLRRIDPGLILSGTERFRIHETKVTGMPVLALLRDGRAMSTILLWFAFFMSMLAINLVSAWMPTFFTHFSTMTLQQAAARGLVTAVAGIVTMLVYGMILDRFGASRVVATTYLLGAVAVAAVGFVDWNSWLFYVVLAAEGVCVIGGQSGINALSAVLYPTKMRATGVSWAFGAGRIGSMFGPGLGGFMLAQNWSVGPVFLVAALPVLAVAIGTSLVNFNAPEKDLSDAATVGAE